MIYHDDRVIGKEPTPEPLNNNDLLLQVTPVSFQLVLGFRAYSLGLRSYVGFRVWGCGFGV